MNDESRMALPIEMDILKLTARVNELEYQVEVLKEASRWLVFNAGEYEYDKLAELKVLINPNLFEGEVYVEKSI